MGQWGRRGWSGCRDCACGGKWAGREAARTRFTDQHLCVVVHGNTDEAPVAAGSGLEELEVLVDGNRV